MKGHTVSVSALICPPDPPWHPIIKILERERDGAAPLYLISSRQTKRVICFYSGWTELIPARPRVGVETVRTDDVEEERR